ncbi:uncharacterized protein BXZ73DRAFT_107186 [Epithele typhae]|uniref:uncharacterized protein n=1 Tax=Epithele typhae TaxID=378194 RepID=UPI002008032F|nr:uncharacterized protein BXZ73DRAFT_107186 [Epithele typhae]KAH9912849.1 hypothetical protein BXZ73DRAFT_107186 [Epithele typhae]
MYLSDIASESYHTSARSRDYDIHGVPFSPSLTSKRRDRPRLRHPSEDAADAPLTLHTHSPRPPTTLTIPLDDNFDATRPRSRPKDYVPDREESVSGYRNYVSEMERMIAAGTGQRDTVARAQERQYQLQGPGQRARGHHPPPSPPLHRLKRSTSTSVADSGALRADENDGRRARGGWGAADKRRAASGGGSGAFSPLSRQAPYAPTSLPSPPENARRVSGTRGHVELVEQRVIEDSPARTITLWRERVAQSSVDGSVLGAMDVDERGETESHAHYRDGGGGGGYANGTATGVGTGSINGHRGGGHRRAPSGSQHPDARLRRVVSEHARYGSSLDGSRTRNTSVRDPEGGKTRRASYERSEYMISYREAMDMDGAPHFVPRSSDAGGFASPTHASAPSPVASRAPPSPQARRHKPQRSLDSRNERERDELVGPVPRPRAAVAGRAAPGLAAREQPWTGYKDVDVEMGGGGSPLRASSTSVELMLASCDPPLLHIAPVLGELGILRVDHLRAVARLSEETRDREVKEEALRRGVTVVEWAIFIDRLQSL